MLSLKEKVAANEQVLPRWQLARHLRMRRRRTLRTVLTAGGWFAVAIVFLVVLLAQVSDAAFR